MPKCEVMCCGDKSKFAIHTLPSQMLQHCWYSRVRIGRKNVRGHLSANGDSGTYAGFHVAVCHIKNCKRRTSDTVSYGSGRAITARAISDFAWDASNIFDDFLNKFCTLCLQSLAARGDT